MKRVIVNCFAVGVFLIAFVGCGKGEDDELALKSATSAMKISFEVSDESGNLIEKGVDNIYSVSNRTEVVIKAKASNKEDGAEISNVLWVWDGDKMTQEVVFRNTCTLPKGLEEGERAYKIVCKSNGYEDKVANLIIRVSDDDTSKRIVRRVIDDATYYNTEYNVDYSVELDKNSPIGTVGVLDGREAMVVLLDGKKVAIATMNVGASVVDDEDGECVGNYYTFDDVKDGILKDGWYVPSKLQLEKLSQYIVWRKAQPGKMAGGVWTVTKNATLFFPAGGRTSVYYDKNEYENWGMAAYYWSTSRPYVNTYMEDDFSAWYLEVKMVQVTKYNESSSGSSSLVWYYDNNGNPHMSQGSGYNGVKQGEYSEYVYIGMNLEAWAERIMYNVRPFHDLY